MRIRTRALPLSSRFLSCILTLCLLLMCVPLSTPVASAASGDVYVGYPSKSDNFRTINEAVAACAQRKPAAESDRITVHIAPGTYREQVLINTPYLTFVNEEPQKGEVKLTWYYGIGYKYYSVGSDGYYNAANAAAKSAKAEPTSRWGCSVYVRSGAVAFRAEHITFEASFNRYVTNEELADGVAVSGSQSITFNRTAGADVTSKAATERAAAMAIDANHAEFYNCAFLGSQDTLYTGSNTVGYFKDCRIEGNTDYIFGGGDYVFDNTELRFFGYSSAAAGGYITAARQQTKGYLFDGCSITGNSGKVVSTGYFGRPWRDTAVVTFRNTKLERESYIHAAGWTSMSGVNPEQASFHEYNTTLPNGAPVNTGSRVWGTVMNQAQADVIKPTDYFGDWTPYYYTHGGTPQSKAVAVLNADDVPVGTYREANTVNERFTILADAASNVVVDNTGAKTTSDGTMTITNRIKLGGAGSQQTRAIRVMATGTGSLTVYMMSSNSENTRTVLLCNRSGAVVDRAENVGGTNLDSYTFAIPSADIYYLMSEVSGVNVYYAALNQTGADTPIPAEGAVMDTTRPVTLQNVNSMLYLGVEDGVAAAGSNVNQQALNPANAAQVTWMLRPAADGYYYIYSCLGNGATYLLDLDYGKTEDGTNIGIYTDTQADAQLFKFVQNDDGSYCIATKATVDASGLSVANNSTDAAANVWQWTYLGNAGQQWLVEAYAPAPEYHVADAIALQRVLLGIDPPAANWDLNDDGKVNGFDLLALKQTLLIA